MLVPEQLYDEAAWLAVEAAKAITVGDPFADRPARAARLAPCSGNGSGTISAEGSPRGRSSSAAGRAARRADDGFFVKPTIFGRVHPR